MGGGLGGARAGRALRSGGRFVPDGPWTRADAVTWLWRLAGSPGGSPVRSFPDVPEEARYHDALDWAVRARVVSGRPDGTFGPGGSVNRAQLATWVWAFAGRPGGAPDHGFVDVPADAWYGAGLDWAAVMDVVRRSADGRYRPGGTVTRAAAARVLFRLDAVA